MGEIKTEWDYAELKKELSTYMLLAKKDFSACLREQARLLGKRLIDYTAPAKSKKFGTAKRAGNMRILRDIDFIFRDLATKIVFKSKPHQKMWARGEYDKLKRVFENYNKKEQMPLFKYKLLRAPDPVIHAKAIDGSGKISRYYKKTAAVTNKRETLFYIRKKQSHLGRLKSGWTAGYAALGGNASGWIKRHGTGLGGYTDATNRSEKPFFEYRNSAPKMPAGMESGVVVARALKSQIMALRETVKRILEHSPKNKK